MGQWTIQKKWTQKCRKRTVTSNSENLANGKYEGRSCKLPQMKAILFIERKWFLQ